MAKNDLILIDSIINDRINIQYPSNDKGEVFEWFSFEQILKDYDLSKDEIENCWVDGRNDGGIDGIFIFINDFLFNGLNDPLLPKKNTELKVIIITCKHADTYKQNVVESLLASCTEMFDFSLAESQLIGDYNIDLLNTRKNLIYLYRKLSTTLSKIIFEFYYVSRGDSTDVGDNIISRSNQLINLVQNNFSNSVCNFRFIGSAELLQLFRKKQEFKLILKFEEQLSSGNQRYIVLTNLSDYYHFVVDDDKKLRKYLFDSNIRDYIGFNQVNTDIMSTLEDEKSPDFWLLNNGVTILATSATNIGKELVIENVQIVNGLQTTESIFRHFNNIQVKFDQRKVLIKVIVTNNEIIRDQIIKATNSQTAVEVQALHATDKIQKDIEDILKKNDYYYNRRTNYYQNLGVDESRILTPLYIAKAYLALIKHNVYGAIKLKQKFMNNINEYNNVFNDKNSIHIWPKLADVITKTDRYLITNRNQKDLVITGYLKSHRYVLSFLTVSRILGKTNYLEKDFSNLNLEEYDHIKMNETMAIINQVLNVTKRNKKISENEYKQIRKILVEKFKVEESNQWLNNQKVYEMKKYGKCNIDIVHDVYKCIKDLSDFNQNSFKKIAAVLGISRKNAWYAMEILYRNNVIERDTMKINDFNEKNITL